MLKSNPMGSIIALINEHDTKEIANIVQKVILYHKNNCDESKCVLCSSLRASIKKEISYDVLCTMLFNYIKAMPKKEKTLMLSNIEFFCYYNLYFVYLTQRSYIKVLLKYNRIKSIMKYSSFTSKSSEMYQNMPYTFILSLELLFNEISNLLLDKVSTPSNLIILHNDMVSKEIRSFINKMNFFLHLDLKSPYEFIKLAHSFSVVKTKSDNRHGERNYHRSEGLRLLRVV